MRRSLPALLALLFSGLVVVVPTSANAASGGGLPIPLPTVPEGDLAGVNDWSCQTSAEHPLPVVLVHGTFGDRRHLLEPMSHSILDAGYCLFSLDYGNRATGDIAASAKTLKKFVTRVRSATGAPKVSLVGHSQGGMMPRYYLKFLGGAKHVDDLIGIAPSNHGTSLVGNFAPVMGVAGPVLDIVCRACTQQGTRSAFLKRLNAGDETPGDVSYTQITTVQDEIVVPHISGYLEAGPRTTNLTLQDACPTAFAEHLLLPGNKAAIAWTLDALSHPGPASKSLEPAC